MNKMVKLGVFSLSLIMAHTVNGADVDVEQLNNKVNQQVEQIAATGLLPTSTEMEVLMGDIVDEEIKKAQADLAAKSNGAGEEPPK